MIRRFQETDINQAMHIWLSGNVEAHPFIAKEKHSTLSLQVYQQNKRAVNFYLREGFLISAEGMDEETDSADYTMIWKNK